MGAGRNIAELIVLFLIAVLFIAARLYGSNYFYNDWSFNYWQFVPLWYSISWLILFITAFSFVFAKSNQIAEFFNSRLKIISGLLIIILTQVLMQFDSVVHAGGNLTI
ncbi:MAG: hypothetical protein V3T75_02890, partial [candidate division Zixibacteria bacterium]